MVQNMGLLSKSKLALKLPVLTSLTLAFAGSCLITLCAKIQIPFWPVPMTLHVLAIFFLSALFGLRVGLLTVGVYLLEGAMGFPVFSGTPQRGIGISYMVGPTGGFLAGFIIAAAIVGYAADKGAREKPFFLGLSMLVGLAVVYVCGASWLAQFTGLSKALEVGVAPFIAGDLLKVLIATVLVSLLSKRLRYAL